MEMKVKFLSMLIVFILCSQFSIAQTIEKYNIDFFIGFNKVVVKEEIVFEEKASGNMLLNIPKDFSGMSFYVDEELITPKLFENNINIELKSAKSIKIIFITREYIDENEFLYHIKMPFDSKETKISLILPEGSVLDKPITEAGSGSVYPKPTRLETDGQSIILIWDYKDLKKGDEKSFFVKYKEKIDMHLYIIGFFVIVVVALLVYIFMVKQKLIKRLRKEGKTKSRKKKKAKETLEETTILKGFEKHLKEDEEQIINILKQREGQCEQGTLRVITGFSKAKLSGILKELEDRRIIFKEKRGKKNLIFLKEP